MGTKVLSLFFQKFGTPLLKFPRSSLAPLPLLILHQPPTIQVHYSWCFLMFPWLFTLFLPHLLTTPHRCRWGILDMDAIFTGMRLQLGVFRFSHVKNNPGLSGAYVTCIYCLSMKTNILEKLHFLQDMCEDHGHILKTPN